MLPLESQALISEMAEVRDVWTAEWTAGTAASEIASMKVDLLREAKESIHFQLTLTPANGPNGDIICRCATCNTRCSLELPRWFVEQHGDKFEESAILRCATSTQPRLPWTVQLRRNCQGFSASPHVRFTSGWRAFAAFNGFVEGDTLYVRLRAMSDFDVYRFGKNGSVTPGSVDGLCEMIERELTRGEEGSAVSVSNPSQHKALAGKQWLDDLHMTSSDPSACLSGVPLPFRNPVPCTSCITNSQGPIICKHLWSQEGSWSQQGSQSVGGNSSSARIKITLNSMAPDIQARHQAQAKLLHAQADFRTIRDLLLILTHEVSPRYVAPLLQDRLQSRQGQAQEGVEMQNLMRLSQSKLMEIRNAEFELEMAFEKCLRSDLLTPNGVHRGKQST